MRLLDLFCGAGGAAMGYSRAGFDEIVGVDNRPQKNYPFEFVQADALEYLAEHGQEFDAIHASPPCQGYGRLQINTKESPKLIELVRQGQLDRPMVIENVPGAPLINPTILCGSMFGLGVWRHRLFEVHGFNVAHPNCNHASVLYPIDVTGTGGPCLSRTTAGGGIHRKPENMAEASRVMGIDWMIRKELTQAVPPAYTKFIGEQLLAAEGLRDDRPN